MPPTVVPDFAAATAGETAFVVAALAVAGFVHGLTGFGFGLVAMALLPIVWPLERSVVAVVVFSLVVTAATLVRCRDHFRWRPTRPLAFGAAAGVPLGLWLARTAGENLTLRGLGAFMMAFAAIELARRSRWRVPDGSGFLFGVGSGALGAAYGVGGPPAVAFVYSRGWPQEQAVAALQVAFLASGACRIAMTAPAALAAPLGSFAWWAAVPAAAAALAVGVAVIRRFGPDDGSTPRPLRFGVFAFLFVMGTSYLFRS